MSLSSLFTVGDFAIAYNAVDTYGLTIGGVAAASNPGPAIKQTSLNGVYDYFRENCGEFELYRNAASSRLATVTIGRVSDQSRVCFFGAGGPAAYVRPASLSASTFTGFADGVAIVESTNYRLFQSVATARVDYTAAQVEVRFEFRGRERAFDTFTTSPFSETQVTTGTATLGSAGVFEGSLSNIDGYAGSFRGQLYGATPSGMTIAYTLRKSNGDLAFGAAGLDAN